MSRFSSAKCFSILADETTDISTNDQFSLCVRYVDGTAIKVYEQVLQVVSVTHQARNWPVHLLKVQKVLELI
jgi:hypothetical protein